MKTWKKLPLKVRKEITSFCLSLAVALGAAVLAWAETDTPLSKATALAVLGSGLRSGLRVGLMKLIKK